MTTNKIHRPHTRRKKSPPQLTLGEFCFGFFSLFCLLLILRSSDIAILYMTRGLLLCAKTVIPSLFPFMVISEIILRSGIGELFCRPLAPICKRLFRIGETGTCAVLLGMLCGFPVGAKCAVNALDSERITKEEAARILTFSNNPSSAFLISAVGVSLWGNRRFGITLYLIVILSQILTGILFGRLAGRQEALTAEPPSRSKKPRLGVTLFTGAVQNACFSMLLVCAYVIFFSALTGTLSIMLEQFSFPPLLKAAVFCVFELSGGVSAASALASPMAAALLAAFAVGWSGLSVHCQILSVCDGRGICFRSYFLAKLLQGALCPLLLFIALSVFPSLLHPAQEAVDITVTSGALPMTTVLFLCLLPIGLFKLTAHR